MVGAMCVEVNGIVDLDSHCLLIFVDRTHGTRRAEMSGIDSVSLISKSIAGVLTDASCFCKSFSVRYNKH